MYEINVSVLYLCICVFSCITASVSCPSGDTPGIIKDSKTCSELVTANNAECYDSTFETTCCESCNNVASNNPNCLYGDINSCFSFLCGSYSDLESCCDTCASFITTSGVTAASTSSSAVTSTSVANNVESSSGTNGGAIAAAVVGSVMGMCLIGACAFFGIKVFKKKGSKVEDNSKTSSSAEITEKLDRYPRTTLGKLNICTVLQERFGTNSDLDQKLNRKSVLPEELNKSSILPNKSDESSDLPEKLDEETPEHSDRPNISNKENVNNVHSETAIQSEHKNTVLSTIDEVMDIQDENVKHEGTNSATGVKYAAVEDHVERRFGLPPMQEHNPDVSHIHERLPPIVAEPMAGDVGNDGNKQTTMLK